MERANVGGLGKIGIITDIEDWELPPEAWSMGYNIRFQDGKFGPFLGHESRVALPQTTSRYLMYTPNETDDFWLVASDDKVYAWDANTTFTDISDISYTATGKRWSGGQLNGVPVINNGFDSPRYWSPQSIATPLKVLPYDALNDWDAKSYRAQVIRPFNNFLFALHINEGANEYPYMVHWSNPADPGTIPATWDYSLTTTLSGRVEIADTPGLIVDGLALGDHFLVYKTDSVWRFTLTSGQEVFRRERLHSMPGMLARGCAVTVENQHVVLGGDDIYVHNGQRYKSIIEDKTRNEFFSLISKDYLDNSFVVKNEEYKEVWFCIATENSSTGYPDYALVWNWSDNTFTYRSLPGVSSMDFGYATPASTVTWDTSSGSWDDQLRTWIGGVFNPNNYVLLGCRPNGFTGGLNYTPVSDDGSQKLYEFDTSGQFDGDPVQAVVRRTGIEIDDDVDFVTVSEIYPHVRAVAGEDPIYIRMGHQPDINGPVSWNPEILFYPNSQRKVDTRATGALHAIQFRSRGDVYWMGTGYLAKYTKSGER